MSVTGNGVGAVRLYNGTGRDGIAILVFDGDRNRNGFTWVNIGGATADINRLVSIVNRGRINNQRLPHNQRISRGGINGLPLWWSSSLIFNHRRLGR